MVKFEELKNLEKHSAVSVSDCDIIADYTNTESGTRSRILKQGERYFFHEQHGETVTACFEIAFSWKSFDRPIFAYTPDDLHEITIDSGSPSLYCHNVLAINEARILPGMTCDSLYHKLTVQFVNDDKLKINDKVLKIENDYEYTYRLRKTKIKAIGGARRLYGFIERIIYEEALKKDHCITFDSVLRTFESKYGEEV